MTDISSPRCFELYRRFDPAGLSLKTFADCLVSNLDGYSRKLSHFWKAKITKSQRFVFLLQPSMLRTGEIDCGLLLGMLPTPRSADGDKGIRTPEGHEKERERRQNGIDLPTAIATMLPTPCAFERDHTTEQTAARSEYYGGTVRAMYLQDRLNMLPTPLTVSDSPAAHGKTNGEWQLKINKMLSTPCQTQYKGSGTNETVRDRLDYDIEKTTDGARTGLKLQPAFVEWMMSFPIGWTDLNHSETP